VVRADLTLAAVLFTGGVDGTLELRYDPFSSNCRLEDWRDADALRISEVRDRPTWP
jgi:hypothetical protein